MKGTTARQTRPGATAETEAPPLTPVEAAATGQPDLFNLRERFDECRKHLGGISQAAAAKQIGMPSGTLSSVLGGTYKGDIEKKTALVEKWIARVQRDARASRGLIDPPGFVLTRVGKRVIDRCHFAQLQRDMVVIYGAAGVGKTQALREFQRRSTAVNYVQANPAIRSFAGAVSEIAKAVGVRNPRRSARELQDDLCHQLKDTEGVLVIDDAQWLGLEALEAIRYIHDTTGIAVVLAGNSTVYASISGGKNRAQFEQLFSRVGTRLFIRGAEKNDAIEIIKKWGVCNAEDCEWLIGRAIDEGGGLRAIVKTLRYAHTIAVGKGAEITPALIKEAFLQTGASDDGAA